MYQSLIIEDLVRVMNAERLAVAERRRVANGGTAAGARERESRRSQPPTPRLKANTEVAYWLAQAARAIEHREPWQLDDRSSDALRRAINELAAAVAEAGIDTALHLDTADGPAIQLRALARLSERTAAARVHLAAHRVRAVAKALDDICERAPVRINAPVRSTLAA